MLKQANNLLPNLFANRHRQGMALLGRPCFGTVVFQDSVLPRASPGFKPNSPNHAAGPIEEKRLNRVPRRCLVNRNVKGPQRFLIQLDLPD